MGHIISAAPMYKYETTASELLQRLILGGWNLEEEEKKIKKLGSYICGRENNQRGSRKISKHFS